MTDGDSTDLDVPLETALVHRPKIAEAIARPELGSSELPSVVYLASLTSKNSVPTMKSALDNIARLVDRRASASTLAWGQLRFQHVAAIRAHLIKTCAPRTVNRSLSALRGVLRASWKLGQINTDDYQRAIDFKGVKTADLAPAGRVASLAEVGAVLRAAMKQEPPKSWRDQAIVLVMVAGGLRRQEASSLDVISYDFERGSVAVRRGKGGKYRMTYLPEGYREFFEPWVSFQKDRGCSDLFVRWDRVDGPTHERLQPSGIDYVLGELVELSGVADLTPHDLRRTFATNLLDNGTDILMVQKLMGHADVKTTAIYDRRGEKSKQAAVENMPIASLK